MLLYLYFCMAMKQLGIQREKKNVKPKFAFIVHKGLMTKFRNRAILFHLHTDIHIILPTAEILSGKNARTWVSKVLYLKKRLKIKILKQNKSPGSRLEVAC